jgi:hypothetical protein
MALIVFGEHSDCVMYKNNHVYVDETTFEIVCSCGMP